MRKSLNILVAEHDRDVAEGLCDILDLAGHRVHRAFTFEKACELLRLNHFDVAFANVKIPHLSKLESFAEVRKIKPDAKLVMMSAHTIDQLTAEVTDGGMVEVLGAPLEIGSVVEALGAIGPAGTLLIDEAPANFANTVQAALKERNCNVAIAHDGDEASAKLAEGSYDVLLLDLHLTAIRSLEVYLGLKRLGCFLPTIIFQSYAEDGPAHNDISRSDILFKPFDPARMVELLERMANAADDGTAAQAPRVAAAPVPSQASESGFGQTRGPGAEDIPKPAPEALSPVAEAPVPADEPADSPPETVPPGLGVADGPSGAKLPAGVGVSAEQFEPAASEIGAAESVAKDEAPAASDVPEAGPEGIRVLVIDDNHDMADGLADILGDAGLNVKVANCAESALATIKDFDAKIALVDIQLGRSSGLELIRGLKELRPELIVVMVTAQTEQETAVEAIRKGAFDYLNKPLHPKELLAAMDRCFDELSKRAKRLAANQGAKAGTDILEEPGAEYMAKLSHKLRTPLNTVVGFSEILSEEMLGPLGSSRYLGYAHDIKEAGKHLMDMIEKFADIDKSENGKLELNETAVDLTRVIFRCLELIQPAVDAGDLTVDIELAEIPVFLIGDRHKLTQVTLSLLTNAVKFTPKQGRINFIQRRDEDGGLVIEVKDTGVGVAEEIISQALSSVIESDGGLSPDYEGSGLGLPLATSIVELHGGTLTLDSEVGKGTTATLRLPPDRNIAPKRSAAVCGESAARM